eukprot:16148809-Heterocapsa_arctica.AAC.1
MEMDGELSSVTTYPVHEEPNIVSEGPMVDELERYSDDVNEGELRPKLVWKVRADELIEVDKHEVYTRVPLAQCWEETGKPPIS